MSLSSYGTLYVWSPLTKQRKTKLRGSQGNSACKKSKPKSQYTTSCHKMVISHYLCFISVNKQIYLSCWAKFRMDIVSHSYVRDMGVDFWVIHCVHEILHANLNFLAREGWLIYYSIGQEMRPRSFKGSLYSVFFRRSINRPLLEIHSKCFLCCWRVKCHSERPRLEMYLKKKQHRGFFLPLWFCTPIFPNLV